MRNVLLEALVMAVAGAAIALVANGISARGLSLSRNYFPGESRVHAGKTNAPVSTTNAVASSPESTGLTMLAEKGLQGLESDKAEQLFQDPRYQSEQIIFIDARDDKHFDEGHIPGAYQLDRFRPEAYLPAVLPACTRAEQVVVYCNGGACEDSLFAAEMLRDNGLVKNEKLFVYTGGIADWQAKGRPIETGARKSGVMKETKK
jgi:rhodanese-related sulfurtransferase